MCIAALTAGCCYRPLLCNGMQLVDESLLPHQPTQPCVVVRGRTHILWPHDAAWYPPNANDTHLSSTLFSSAMACSSWMNSSLSCVRMSMIR
jgi:hypothetical protein